MEALRSYLRESWQEFAHRTTWPTWIILQRSAVVVIVASLVFALIVFAMDKGLSTVLDFVYSIFA
ncbi:MAG: preprotein translocase subunit SecE [Schleiferiaceae bacterium]|jgi:preprotein translocase subunit SecE